MSVHRRIADLIPGHGEGQLMTRLGHSRDSPMAAEGPIDGHIIKQLIRRGGRGDLTFCRLGASRGAVCQKN